jgi:hypothetical protein
MQIMIGNSTTGEMFPIQCVISTEVTYAPDPKYTVGFESEWWTCGVFAPEGVTVEATYVNWEALDEHIPVATTRTSRAALGRKVEQAFAKWRQLNNKERNN